MRTNSIRDIKEQTSKTHSASSFSKKTLFSVLDKIQCGRLIITENGESTQWGETTDSAFITARIDIHDDKFYSMIMQNGMIGAAEAYMQQVWTTPDLVVLIRLMVKNLAIINEADKRSPLKAAFLKLYDFLHINNLSGSKRNIAAHYDLGNDFFALFLDKSMMYSSAIFPANEYNLDVAATYKLERICQKLDLQPTDHLLEIGTGWGGLACYAALHYGCKVTTTTLSQEQYDKAQDRVNQLGLNNKITLLLQDYRLLQGTYDKLVSVEMIEAVGHQYYGDYFRQCSRLLTPAGLMLIQSILISDQRYDSARKSIDFIKRYIFPGGCLPSNEIIAHHVSKNTDMQIIALDDITYDYAKTLAAWRERFFAALPEIRQQGFSEEFIRMWDFYFCYCQAGFMERSIHTAQLAMAKPQWRDSRYPG